MPVMKQKLAIFLSGSGSNARAVCQYFKGNEHIEVALLLSNREQSGAAAIAREFGLPCHIFDREQFYHTSEIPALLSEQGVTAIVLAGFLWLIPENLLDQYPDRILNIHPALLPEYGGKGMHGMRVHEAVKANREKESGISIHLCNKEYDKGRILFQKRVAIREDDSPQAISERVLQIEHTYYPKIIEAYLLGKPLPH